MGIFEVYLIVSIRLCAYAEIIELKYISYNKSRMPGGGGGCFGCSNFGFCMVMVIYLFYFNVNCYIILTYLLTYK